MIISGRARAWGRGRGRARGRGRGRGLVVFIFTLHLFGQVTNSQIIAFGANYCDISLVSQARVLAQDLLRQRKTVNIIFAGHSLGGTAAFCLGLFLFCFYFSAGIFPNTRSVSLNGGASASNPVLVGPGPGRATFYHVFGDIVSTHMSPNAAKVIRFVCANNN